MSEKETQKQRLLYLVEEFKADSDEYKDLEIPADSNGRQQVLRALMNVRMPKRMPEKVLQVQDEYLQERAREKGIVAVDAIPTVRDSLGSSRIHADQISIWQGDITCLACDAIVNAANSQMLGCFVPLHSCIDNCIHTYAGIQLREECNRQMGQLRMKYGRYYEQPTAVPMLTDAYNLPAQKVIHIVGPIVQGRLTPKLEQALADCYRNTLDVCLENGLKSVAFCCISTGVFHFPNELAARIAVDSVTDWLSAHSEPRHGIADGQNGQEAAQAQAVQGMQGALATQNAPDTQKDQDAQKEQNAQNAQIERVIFNVFKDEDKALYEELLL